ncbi:hypothetical protein AB0I00_10710 [Streptomyces sp. NPDC050803]|uniref:HEAT repeat domain-containing protein n=1 Tax=unclassified Streptomyces TaxID=2593676 RepID=UPI00343F620D
MFFGRRRAQKEQERREELSLRLRSAQAEVRAAAATEIAEAPDLEWAVRELARALDREPTPETFHDIAWPFSTALRRDRATRQHIEHMFASRVDDPAALVQDWTALLAEYGADTAVETVDDDLAEDVRGRLERLRKQGWRHHELARMKPDSYAYMVAFGTAVELLHEAMLRAVPLASDQEERSRKETQAAFAQALAHAPDSEERSEILIALSEGPDDESWTDRPLAALHIEEALALCRSAEPDRVTLGVEALHCMLLFNDALRRGAIRATLDRLCVPEQEPFTLSTALRCYTVLRNHQEMADPPVEVFLTALHHPDARVRAAAASGLDPMAGEQPQEARAVAELIDVMDHDPDITVARCAARSLALIVCAEEAHTRTASRALARRADAEDAGIRAAVVEGALFREEPGAFARLTAELQRSDVEPAFIAAIEFICGLDVTIPDDARAELTGLLEHLEQAGWAELPADDENYPDPEDREELLEQALEALRPTPDAPMS